MFCSNCGNPLAEGAKFCSECGTRVEETKVRDFGTLEINEPSNFAETLTGKKIEAEEAFDARVSFDWSNVIDEPQKKEIPSGIKSPWAATTDGIDEREIYSEMNQSDDKNRTMSYIDVLKADKEERERAALDRSIEYTEVLEYDPELVGGTKPPKLRMAPLYEDVDAPVKTPFDDMETSDEPEMAAESFDKPAEEKQSFAEEKKPEVSSSKFELPDFLKKAVGFGAGKDEVVDIKRDEDEKEVIQAEEPKIEETPVEKAFADEVSFEEPLAEEAPAVEETPAAEEKTAEETLAGFAENTYLDEDIYLDLSEEPRSERISRVMAHTSEYEIEDEDDDAESEDAAVDETELFSEMTEPEPKKTGMTIAAPADEEAEIEALKRKLAELTGTVEIDPELIKEAEEEETVPEHIETPAEETVEEPAEEGSFEAMGADFTFEPEVTEADNALFAGLTAASEPSAPAEEVKAEQPSFGLSLDDEITANKPEVFEQAPVMAAPEEPVVEPFPVEPAAVEPFPVEPAAAEFIPEEPAAIEPAPVEPAAELISEEPAAVEPAPVEPAVAEPVTEEPAAEPTVDELLAKYVPQYFGAEAAKAENEPAAEPAPVTEPEPAAVESPIVGFAPAVTEAPKEEQVFNAQPAAPEALKEEQFFDAQPVAPEAPVIRLEDFGTEPAEPVKPVWEAPAAPEPVEPVKPAWEAPAAPVQEEPKTSDAVSLDDLEKDIFGAQAAEGGEAETTKKIDKFYTLYRKNEEFQRLLDEEYSRLKGEHIEIPEEEPVGLNLGASAEGVAGTIQGTAEGTIPAAAEKAPADFSATAILEELGESKTPVEDATIYRDMPEELTEAVKNSDASGFSVEGTEAKSFGLDASDAVAVATAAAGAAAAGAAMTKAEKKAAKKAEKKAKKEAAAAAQVEYEDVDTGSTVLTILAVIVAVLLVVLLAIILILHIAPNSELALTIDQFIENITSRFSAVNMFGGHRLL